MSLIEIKNRLYKKNIDPDLYSHDESEFDSRSKDVGLGHEDAQQEDVWREEDLIPEEEKRKTFKIALIALSCISLIMVVLVGVYYVRNHMFGSDKVALSIIGPTESRSGKPLVYEISYDNRNAVSLDNSVLRITHPENFKPEESASYQDESPTVSVVKIGKIDAGSGGKIAFSGISYAPKGTLAYLKIDLTYKPSNLNSEFVASSQIGINITSTPMTIEVLAPQDMSNGNALDYQISYKNVGAEDYDNIRIKADFPDGFTFSKSVPNVSESQNIWYIGHLSAGEGGKIVISGKLQGDRDSSKAFKAYIGAINQGQFVSYNDETVLTKIVASPLSISQTVNNAIDYHPNAGESLRFEIKYKNDGNIGLKNLIVTEKLDSPILDYTSIDFEGGGAYDTENKLAVWKASDHAQLASLDPGQEGSIRFSIKIKDLIPVSGINDKNFIISSIVKIDSPDIPTPINMNKVVAGNEMDMKLNSKIIMDVSGFYADAYMTNSGPIPPAVGQETTYAIHLKVGNVSNDVTDAKIDIVLPTGVTATDKVYPSDAPIDYNERTNQLTWSIGTLKAGEGILAPFREAVFQVKVKPSADQVGQSIDILKESNFSGKDSFTGETLSVKYANKTTQLMEDNTIGIAGWRVVQ